MFNNTMELTGKNFIAGQRTGSGKAFKAENPATGKMLEPSFYEAGQKEIDQAIQQAEEAFHTYNKKSGKQKADLLEAIADEIMALGDVLLQRCMEETGLPEVRLTGERGRTVNQLKLFAQVLREGSWVNARIDLADPDRKPLPKPDVRSMYRPLGPVGIFGASNFPFAFSVAGGDTVTALAAGCTVVVKAHPAHPGTCELVANAIQRAVEKSNMPAGTFSLDAEQTSHLRLIINNLDNEPLKITGIDVDGPAVELIAEMEPGNTYLFYGNRGLSAPYYELKHFEEKIPTASAVATLGEEESIAAPQTKISALFENKFWLWGIMIVVIGLLGFFTLRMMKGAGSQ